uniref:Sugar phosphate transporter domain-containing protein n=1 Tax=Clastoptera arizonana TaxID=38151 RepID=A0A1B6DZF6_9HEMI
MYSLNLCSKIHCSELFPTKWSVFVFIAYMAFFINQGLLVTASQQSNNAYGYNTVVAVLLTELVKLCISIILYAKNNSLSSLINETKAHSSVMWQYFVPACLYCFYNNLAFVNLSVFDPTTYYLLLQMRVVITGVLYQILFKRQLSGKQWLSLVMLTAGCMVKQLPFGDEQSEEVEVTTLELEVVVKPISKVMTPRLSWNMVLILIQVICSCLAGVYNEVLLKGYYSMDCNVYIQNIFMYVDSIICNLVVLLWQGDVGVLFDSNAMNSIMHFKVLLVIFNNAAIGITTSFVLRSLNSILKTFASALELVFTALLARLFFEIPIYANTICAIFIVSLAVFIYSQNPVINKTKSALKEVVSV